jgi:hypothetical protein
MKNKRMSRPRQEGSEQEYAAWAEWCNTNGYMIQDDNPEYYYCAKVEETEQETTVFKISELKNKLKETDYKALKYAEGFLSEAEYAETKTQRQAWRDEINALEAKLQEAAL